MPRKSSKPIAEAIANSQTAEQIVHETSATMEMPAELVPVRSPETDFDPAAIEQGHAAKFAARHEARRAVLCRNANVEGVAADYVSGVFVDVEKERQPGNTVKRVFVRFADGAEPTPEEREIVKNEGFRYDKTEKAWAAPATAVNKELAKRVANAVIESRDPDGTKFYI